MREHTVVGLLLYWKATNIHFKSVFSKDGPWPLTIQIVEYTGHLDFLGPEGVLKRYKTLPQDQNRYFKVYPTDGKSYGYPYGNKSYGYFMVIWKDPILINDISSGNGYIPEKTLHYSLLSREPVWYPPRRKGLPGRNWGVEEEMQTQFKPTL